MLKTHYEHGPHGTACGRASTHTTTNVYRVTCLSCKSRDQFLVSLKIADDARKAAFEAQVPRQFDEPWHRDQKIICKSCGGDTFRHGGRTCYGHYDNWHCANCDNVESRLTETGMSF